MRRKYDPNIHNRRSIRIPGYDYSQPGWYFITICTKDNTCIFGQTVNDHISLNSPGRMLQTWWQKLPDKFKAIQTDEYIVMPNHFHGIINILQPVRAAPCGRPNPPNGCPDPPKLGDIIRWFKTMTTNQYMKRVKQNQWPPFNGKLWQRNYYEHIIRNENELNQIRQYIRDNVRAAPRGRPSPARNKPPSRPRTGGPMLAAPPPSPLPRPLPATRTGGPMWPPFPRKK